MVLIVFFVTACVSTVRYLCVSMQTAFTLPPTFFLLQSQLLPSYPPLRRRIVQQPGRRLFSTLLSPAPVAKATNQKLSALWSTTRAPPALPTRKNTQGAAISCDAAFGKCPQCSSEMGTERERETGHHDEGTVLGTAYSVHYGKSACCACPAQTQDAMLCPCYLLHCHSFL